MNSLSLVDSTLQFTFTAWLGGINDELKEAIIRVRDFGAPEYLNSFIFQTSRNNVKKSLYSYLQLSLLLSLVSLVFYVGNKL